MRALRTDPVVTEHIDYIASATPEEVHAWLVGTMDHNRREPRLSWNLSIVRREDGPVLGWIGIGRASDTARGEMDFGYALLREQWGHGYATEALRALVAWCFGHLPVNRIYGECDADNPRSARVMAKAGFAPDPHHAPPGQLAFALTRAQWETECQNQQGWTG